MNTEELSLSYPVDEVQDMLKTSSRGYASNSIQNCLIVLHHDSMFRNAMLRTPNCPFVLYVGTKKLVKRREFEQFISDRVAI